MIKDCQDPNLPPQSSVPKGITAPAAVRKTFEEVSTWVNTIDICKWFIKDTTRGGRYPIVDPARINFVRGDRVKPMLSKPTSKRTTQLDVLSTTIGKTVLHEVRVYLRSLKIQTAANYGLPRS